MSNGGTDLAIKNKLKGEIIISPFSFIVLQCYSFINRLKPVFCDIDNQTFNIDPNKIEKLITPKYLEY